MSPLADRLPPDLASLLAARALFPPALHDRVFLVGGAVRDQLLGVATNDLDLIVAVAEKELVGRNFRPVSPKSAAPIYFRPAPDGTKIEITRIDALEGLEDDLRHRDFTVNAIAAGLDGALIDPLCGRDDLATRTLRLCSPDAFDADPARIWRAFRFEAHGWRLGRAAETILHERDWNDALAQLPVERFSQEMLKALAGDDPARFFRRMLDCNAGRNVLPELFRMPHVPAGPPEHHPEGDLLTHSCQVLERIAPLNASPLARFCAFFHDLGKLATDPAHYPKHHGHDERGAKLAEPFCNRLALPAEWRKALACISRHHGTANRWDETRDSTRIRIADACLKSRTEGLLPQIAAADYPRGPGMPDWSAACAAARATVAELGIALDRLDEIPPQERGSILMHHRVELLRAFRRRNL